jgi:hypothetical protein
MEKESPPFQTYGSLWNLDAAVQRIETTKARYNFRFSGSKNVRHS